MKNKRSKVKWLEILKLALKNKGRIHILKKRKKSTFEHIFLKSRVSLLWFMVELSKPSRKGSVHLFSLQN